MTLTLEQQQMLDDLMKRVPSTTTAVGLTAGPDFLKTFLGISSDDLKTRLQTLLEKKDHLERRLLDSVDRNPLEASFRFLALAALAFYVAEKDVNPKVRTYIDAFYYISTCASVGYADIFAVTQQGRAVASLVMTVGPALAAKSLDRPERQV